MFDVPGKEELLIHSEVVGMWRLTVSGSKLSVTRDTSFRVGEYIAHNVYVKGNQLWYDGVGHVIQSPACCKRYPPTVTAGREHIAIHDNIIVRCASDVAPAGWCYAQDTMYYLFPTGSVLRATQKTKGWTDIGELVTTIVSWKDYALFLTVSRHLVCPVLSGRVPNVKCIFAQSDQLFISFHSGMLRAFTCEGDRAYLIALFRDC
jgi:hypothetical protein